MDFNNTSGEKADAEHIQSTNRKSETDTEHSECDEVASSTSEESYPAFETLYENVYLGNKKKRVNKEIRRMSCDCSYCPDEVDFVGCGDDCLNRLLMIECNSRCPCGEFCSNRKFQEGQKVRVEAFKTEKKGWGLRTLEDISVHQFIIEYSGEVMGYDKFEKRVEMYDKENRRHYYFMTLRADEIIDATYKGNLSRFINHSCSPNCETQKWTVNGYLRIGFFSIRDIPAGTELTFDYKFQRYGKKAQKCYCDAQNCRGIIGGDKHTPLKSIIGRAVSPAPTSSPRRNRRRQLAEQFNDKPFELEIAQILGDDKGIKTDDQALKLSQLMVRAETTSQRLLLLDTLAATVDQSCLRNFVKYQGLSLLWSWMVDPGENTARLQKKIVQVLKHLPVANLNQVKDTKVLKVIRKWANKPSVSSVPEEETSSSDVDSRGLSPPDAIDDASRLESHVSSSSDELQDPTKSIEMLESTDNTSVKSDVECGAANLIQKTRDSSPVDDIVFEPGEIRSDEEQKPEGPRPDELNSRVQNSEDHISEGQKSEGLKSHMVKTSHRHKRSMYHRIIERIGDSSEEESSRWSEDDTTSSDSESIVDLASDLLDQWSSLKEVYRIPKKSTLVVQREPESTSGTSEGNASDSNSSVRMERNAPVIPKIEEDLFKKDEFLSKLGERESHALKSSQRNTPPTSSDLPSLMTAGLTDSSEGNHDVSRVPIHQRLQNVANTGCEEKFSGWHAKAGSRRAGRKGRYPSPRGGQQNWSPRHQAPSSQFNPPTTNPSTHPGIPRGNIQNNPWHQQQQESSSHNRNPYPNSSHGVQSEVQVSSATQYQPGNQNPTTTTTGQAPYYQASEPPKPEQQTGYQTSWNSNPTLRPDQGTGSVQVSNPVQQGASHVLHGFGQLPPPPPQHSQVAQGQFPTGHTIPPSQSQQFSTSYSNHPTPFGYQQSTNPNQPYSRPLFNPFVPNQNNPPSHQFPPNYPPPFPTNPATYSITTPASSVPTYSVNPMQQPHFGLKDQNPGSSMSMVSSTVGGSGSMHGVDPKSEWSGDKTQEPSLPPDWKKAFDGEGRTYYYHVVTRQTQWEPPVTDRSPPTPEVGYLGDELDSRMDSVFSSHVPQDVTMEVIDSTKQRKKPRTPSTPPGSPPKSPVSKYTTAAADTTDIRKGAYSPSSLLQGRHLTPEQRKRRETFRMKLSAVVVNYLNPYHKLDCKIGRITTVDDFKFLARKLTHGVMVKELNRIKDESQLACNDSVKIKTKEYIRNYMQRFGSVYKPS